MMRVLVNDMDEWSLAGTDTLRFYSSRLEAVSREPLEWN